MTLVMLLTVSGQIMAQTQTRVITGKVTDASGAAVPNASILVKGSNAGTSTAADGTFSLNISNSARALVISSVGMSTLELNIGNRGVFNITLSTAEKGLTEVVVTALGIKKDKKTLGYGITNLKADEVTTAHTTNVTNALEGKIPGVRISGSGGSFTGSSIIIRGFTTFTGTNQPLFVVDGVPIDNGGGGSPLQTGPPVSNRGIDINQEDIDNISVLKGPAAAALYGSRGAAGAILITTKKGKLGQKGTIDVYTSYGAEKVNRFPDYQNQYAEGDKGVYNPLSQNSWGPLISGQTVTNAFGKQEQLKAYPNNVKDMFRTAQNLQENVSFSGGSDRNTFRFSYGLVDNSGVLDNNRLRRHNLSINTSSQVNNRLTVAISANYTNNTSRRTQQGNQLSNPLFRGWLTPRSYDLTGIPFQNAAGDQMYPLGEDNPYWSIQNNRFKDEINRLFGNVSVNMKIAPWLTFDYRLGTDVYWTFRHGYDQIGIRGQGNVANTAANTSPFTGVGPAGNAGGVLEVRNSYRSWNSTGYFTATKKISDFNLMAIVGNETFQTYTTTDQTIGYGVVVRDFENLKNTTSYNPSNGSTTFRLVSLYGDFTAAYKSIASVNASLRNDWSSTFKPSKYSFPYYAVSASINFTELFPQLKNNIIENIKINGNYAKVGKAGDFVYATDSYYGAASSADGFGPAINFPFNGLAGFTLNDQAGNAKLGPEFTTNREIGFNLAFFKNRLSLEGAIYQQKSRDLIFAVPVSNASGIGSLVQNAGSLTNKGFELAVNITPVRTNDFTWNINWNYTKLKSVVDELAPGVTNIFLGGFTTPNIRLVKGDEYGQIYGNAYQRDSKTNKMLINPTTGLPLVTTGVQKIGNPNPKWLMGLTNTVSYKGITLSVLLDIRHGGQQYSRNIKDLRTNGTVKETANLARLNADGTPARNMVFDGVYSTTGQQDTTHVTMQDYWGNSGKYVAAEGFILDASWFRIREASLSYRLPSSMSQKTPFSHIDISVYGRNLFLHTPNYPHLDPEQNALGISNAVGLEFNALPQTKSMGVALKFGL
ncbi:MAG TPA: SusC/RagA family TonB-linked outer membrane protein [Puia sp.]